MSSPPGNFYAFFECDGGLHLGVFPSRAHADKFWRIIPRIKGGGPCRRYHSQHYVVPVLPDKLRNDPNWNETVCLVRPVEDEDNLPVIPPDQYPDYRNGASFYIRSTLHPNFYWYLNRNNGRVELSKTNQTRFTITRVGTPPSFATAPSRSDEDILIAEDTVTLSVGYNGHRMHIVPRGQDNTMAAANQQGPFQFGMFDKGFCGYYDRTDSVVYATSNANDVGERWELVA